MKTTQKEIDSQVPNCIQCQIEKLVSKHFKKSKRKGTDEDCSPKQVTDLVGTNLGKIKTMKLELTKNRSLVRDMMKEMRIKPLKKMPITTSSPSDKNRKRKVCRGDSNANEGKTICE